MRQLAALPSAPEDEVGTLRELRDHYARLAGEAMRMLGAPLTPVWGDVGLVKRGARTRSAEWLDGISGGDTSAAAEAAAWYGKCVETHWLA